MFNVLGEGILQNTFRPSSDLGMAAIADPIVKKTALGLAVGTITSAVVAAAVPVVKTLYIDPAVQAMQAEMISRLPNPNGAVKK